MGHKKIYPGDEIDYLDENLSTGTGANNIVKLDGSAKLPAIDGSNLTNLPSGASLSTIYPVGCIYISTVSTNPATLFGMGTWVAFGAGRVLVGLDAGQTEFDTVEETGGAKIVQSSAQAFVGTPGSTSVANVGATQRGSTGSTLTLKAHTHPFTPEGTNTPGVATSVVQPYIVCYFWKRLS